MIFAPDKKRTLRTVLPWLVWFSINSSACFMIRVAVRLTLGLCKLRFCGRCGGTAGGVFVALRDCSMQSNGQVGDRLSVNGRLLVERGIWPIRAFEPRPCSCRLLDFNEHLP